MKAVRRCFKKQGQGSTYSVGVMCNKLGAKKKFASGDRRVKRPPSLSSRMSVGLRSAVRAPIKMTSFRKKKKNVKINVMKADGTKDKRYK